MNPYLDLMQTQTRRHFLRDCQVGLGGIALSTSVTYVIVAAVFWIRLPKGNVG